MEEQFRRFEELVTNVATVRHQFLDSLMDPRRDYFAECGFPKTVSPQMYQDLIDRNPYAARACEVMPKEACQTQLTVYDSEDDEETPFEASRKELNRQLNGIHSYFSEDASSVVDQVVEDAAIAAGAGHYSVILIGLNDGMDLSEPVPGVEESYSMPAKKPPEPDVVDDTDPEKPKVYKDPITNWNDPYKDTLTFNSSLPKPKGIYSLRVDRNKTDQVLTTNLSDPANPKVEKAQGRREVSYLRVFPETRAMVTRWESNRTSPRYNQPCSYLISLDAGTSFWTSVAGMPSNTVDVHWTRVVHVPGPGKTVNPVASQPLLEPILNPLLNLDKITGASGEAYWKSCFNILILKTVPQLGGNVKINRENLKDQVENLENTLQRVLYLMGMEAQTVAPQVIDPTPHIQVNVSAVCVQLSVPVPVFQGYEIGEQASENNDTAWDDRVAKFQRTYLVPKVAVPLYDRLILVGVLEEPGEDGYKAEYEPRDRQSSREKAEIAVQLTSAMANYVASGMAEYVGPQEYMTEWLGFNEDRVEAWLKESEKRMMEEEAENTALAEEQGMINAPPDGYEWDDPEPPQLGPVKMKTEEKLAQPEMAKSAKPTGGRFSANGEHTEEGDR